MGHPVRAVRAWLVARWAVWQLKRLGALEPLMELLKGWKTYLAALAALCTAAAGLATGAMDWPEACHLIETSALVATLRHGLATKAGTAIVPWLAGHKTYIVAAASSIGAVAGLASGALGPAEAMKIVVTALMGLGLRSAQK